MYVDFELNSIGDIVFDDDIEKSYPQKVSFNMSHTSSQKVSINIYDGQSTHHNTCNYLKVEFFIDNKKANSSTKILCDNNAKAQLIALKLKTTLGELPERKEFGTKLSIFRHEILDDNSLKALGNYVKAVLEKDVPNIAVNIRPIIDYNNGYKQTVVIDIYSGSNLMLDYKIER